MKTTKQILEAMPLYQKLKKHEENSMSNQLKKTMNATVVTGQYTDNQGNQKKSYLTIGKLFIYNDGGMSLKLDALPLNNQNINFYDIKPKNQNTNSQQNQQHQQNYNHGGNGNNYNQPSQNQGY